MKKLIWNTRTTASEKRETMHVNNDSLNAPFLILERGAGFIVYDYRQWQFMPDFSFFGYGKIGVYKTLSGAKHKVKKLQLEGE